MKILHKVGRLSVLATLLAGTSAFAEEGAIEEVVVTGSYIKGTPEDAELPVDVINRADLEDIGNPSVIEMVRNLSITSGNLGETNQFQGNGGQANEGVATINLRGLGAARTLVLLNGRRQVSSNAQGVDVNAMPAFAIGRVEVLKDGAAALYGSDAIGGVVNFITRDDVDGLEIGGSYQGISDGGDFDVNALWGYQGDQWNVMVAGEYAEREEIPFKDRDWAVLPYTENPQGGWSSISNAANILFPGVGVIPDPRCQDLGSFRNGINSCGFQFTFFDNLVEKTESEKLFAQFNYDVNENMAFHAEAMYANTYLPEWKTSPSYPPQSLFGADRLALPNHPGLVALRAQYPTLPQNGVAIPIARALGVSGKFGEPETGTRETETTRLALALEGVIPAIEVDYKLSASYSKRVRELEGDDMFIENMAFAMRGLGGANCNRAAANAAGTHGQGNCLYYNPFSNAIERSAVTGFTNPDFRPNLANSREVIDYLFSETSSKTQNELLVFEAIFSGMSSYELAGGNIGWAAGAQSRRERFDYDLADIGNRELNPCPWTDPLSITLGFTTTLSCAPQTGRLAFLAASDEETTSRIVYGVFGELNLPFTDTFNVQAAVRFEDYGGQVGSTIDPKIAFSWNLTDELSVRGSASTTFRGPPQSFLSGTDTGLQFNAAVNAFKAVDIVGNPNLKPESAVTSNLGVIYQNEIFYASIDWWRYDFKDPLQAESAGQIVAGYAAQQCQDGGAGAATTSCQALRSHIFPLGTSLAGLQRTETFIINGSDIETSGIDAQASYDINDVLGGTITLGLELTYTLEYKSDDFVDINGAILAPGGDFAGLLNDGTNPFQSLPELKGNASVKYTIGEHRFNFVTRYISSYDDADTTFLNPASDLARFAPQLAKIDDQVTFDMHYNTTLFEDFFVSLSLINITDEDPPQAATDLNYDPYTHNPFGRMIKLGMRYSLGGN
jgi:iron complex outermembrane recepter protein